MVARNVSSRVPRSVFGHLRVRENVQRCFSIQLNYARRAGKVRGDQPRTGPTYFRLLSLDSIATGRRLPGLTRELITSFPTDSRSFRGIDVSSRRAIALRKPRRRDEPLRGFETASVHRFARVSRSREPRIANIEIFFGKGTTTSSLRDTWPVVRFICFVRDID